MVRLLLLLLSAAQLSQCAKVEDPKECEVCISNLEQIEQLIDKDQKASKQSITEAISKHCGDLQNEKPNPALSQKDRKMCYYFEPIKAAIAQPFSTRMPKDRVCKRLKKENPEICQIKYAVVVETAGVSAEEMLRRPLKCQAKLKKMRVKELKGILADRGAACDGCLEKDDFIKKIVETQGTEL